MKDKADLLEAFLGALYIDKDLQYCEVFSQVGGCVYTINIHLFPVPACECGQYSIASLFIGETVGGRKHFSYMRSSFMLK